MRTRIRRCWLRALTPQFNVKEVCSLVLQEDAVRGGGLEVKRDVAAGLSSVQREVEVGGGAAEGRRIPVVAFEKQAGKDTFESSEILQAAWRRVSLTVSFAPQGSHRQLGLRPGSACIANHHLTDRQVVLVHQQP